MVTYLPICIARTDENRRRGNCEEGRARDPGELYPSKKPGWCGFKGSNRMRYGIALLICFCILFLAHPTIAGIYKYEDENGVLHFTNCPRDPKFKLYLREGKEDSPPPIRTVSLGQIKDSTIFDHVISEYSRNIELTLP